MEPPGWANPYGRNRSWARGKLVKKIKELNGSESCVVDWARVSVDVATLHLASPGVFELNDPFAWDLPAVKKFLEAGL